ncbi:MAG: hypothetical protein AB1346_07635 [Thermodesulfobacteriota bacterium]
MKMNGNGSRPWEHLHEIHMESTGIDRFLEEMEEMDKGFAAREETVEDPYAPILKMTNDLAHLVQGGRYVSQEQLTEVGHTIKSSNGYF